MTLGKRPLTINEAAAQISVSRRTIYNWLSSGKLPCVRTPGGKVRIFESDLYRHAQRDTDVKGAGDHA